MAGTPDHGSGPGPAAVSRFEVAGPLPATSLALEASAGTGKTWTLTALTVRYIAERDIPLSDLLLVTFTRAATAELRERVRLRITEVLDAADRAAEDPDGWTATDEVLDRVVGDALRLDDGTELDLRRSRLRAAAQELDEATISTIHGFCQKMLQHAALEAGVDFDAVLLDDDADLLAEIVDDHLARELRPAPAAWVRYLQDAGGINREQLTRLARAVAALPALQLRPQPESGDEPCWTCWGDAVERFAECWRNGGREQAVDLVGRLKDDGAFAQPRQTTFTAKTAEEQAAAVDRWLEDPPELPPGEVDRSRTGHRSAAYPMAYFTEAALRTKLDENTALPDLDVLDAAAGLLEAAMRPATIFLQRAAVYIWHELDRRKHQRTVLTFDDLLRRLADALDQPATRDAVRKAIRQRYQVALIDEFQDTDPVQWRIFSSLFEDGEPFVLIGDPKQAIYSFRGADIHTYVDARDTRADLQTLGTNHRSDATYVAACNQLFGRDGTFGTADIEYRAIDPRHPDRLTDPSGGAALQLRFVPRAAGPTNRNLLTKGWADRVLPGDVAAVTVSLLDDGLTIDDEATGQPRPVAPEDIAVLVRTNRRADAVQQALRDAGVPAVIQRGGNVFATDEAEALQRLLTAMLRPSSERAAVVAAASILFGRDAPTLVAQREALDRHDGSAGQVDEGVDEGEDPAREWDRWIDALTRWGERWHRSGLLPAVRMAFADDSVPERLLTTPEGERRLTNVRHLVELLHAAEVTDGLTPLACIDWLRTHRADAEEGDLPSTETELRLEEDAEAVRVVTVHGSKGLQYPIVLCPDLWDGRLRVDKRLTRFHDPDIADPSSAITLDVDADETSAGKQRSIDLARVEERAEQLRLAYVALTRAQHRCIAWWGPFGDSPTSALATLLHGHPTDDAPDADRLERGEARLTSAEDAELIVDLEALAGEADGAIDVTVLDEPGRDASWESEHHLAPSLEARPFHRRLDLTWRRTSFTSLVRDVDHHAPATTEDPGDGRDVDALSELDGEAPPPTPDTGGADRSPGSPAPELALLDLPRGAGPGTFIHDVLERADLTRMDDDAAMDQLLAAMERRHGIDPAHRPAVLAGLRAAVTTELTPVADDVRLADLGLGDRLNELRFELPLGGGRTNTAERLPFALRAVADLLESASDPVIAAYAERLRDPGLPRHVRGFLNGSIDLLTRLPDGRFLVADYKSNWLGDRATGRSVAHDYRPGALHAAMTDSHYVLQALLYLVAAHRYLRWRIPGYDYDTHVAGATCLYVRGMVGPDTPVIDGGSCGVGAIFPDGALIRSLSRLLEGAAS